MKRMLILALIITVMSTQGSYSMPFLEKIASRAGRIRIGPFDQESIVQSLLNEKDSISETAFRGKFQSLNLNSQVEFFKDLPPDERVHYLGALRTAGREDDIVILVSRLMNLGLLSIAELRNVLNEIGRAQLVNLVLKHVTMTEVGKVQLINGLNARLIKIFAKKSNGKDIAPLLEKLNYDKSVDLFKKMKYKQKKVSLENLQPKTIGGMFDEMNNALLRKCASQLDTNKLAESLSYASPTASNFVLNNLSKKRRNQVQSELDIYIERNENADHNGYENVGQTMANVQKDNTNMDLIINNAEKVADTIEQIKLETDVAGQITAQDVQQIASLAESAQNKIGNLVDQVKEVQKNETRTGGHGDIFKETTTNFEDKYVTNETNGTETPDETVEEPVLDFEVVQEEIDELIDEETQPNGTLNEEAEEEIEELEDEINEIEEEVDLTEEEHVDDEEPGTGAPEKTVEETVLDFEEDIEEIQEDIDELIAEETQPDGTLNEEVGEEIEELGDEIDKIEEEVNLTEGDPLEDEEPGIEAFEETGEEFDVDERERIDSEEKLINEEEVSGASMEEEIEDFFEESSGFDKGRYSYFTCYGEVLYCDNLTRECVAVNSF